MKAAFSLHLLMNIGFEVHFLASYRTIYCNMNMNSVNYYENTGENDQKFKSFCECVNKTE